MIVPTLNELMYVKQLVQSLAQSRVSEAFFSPFPERKVGCLEWNAVGSSASNAIILSQEGSASIEKAGNVLRVGSSKKFNNIVQPFHGIKESRPRLALVIILSILLSVSVKFSGNF